MWARSIPLFLVALLLSMPARAETWMPRVSLGSDFPVAASARLAVDTPVGVTVGGSVGILPGVYADAINGIAVSMGGYDEETAEVIRRSLRSSLVLSGSVGTDVVARLRLHADYTLVSLGGATTTPDMVASVAGVPLPFGEEGRDVEISSTLQMLGLGVSWPFTLAPSLTARVGLGARFTLAASTQVESSGRSAREESYERDAERRLDEIYTSYAHTPVLSLHFEYGF